MEWWSMTATEVLKKLRTEERTGLSENEAKKRLETDGRNRTEQGEGKKGFRRRFLAQFNDFMILLLIGAAVASVAISYWNGEKDFLDAAIILAIVALNAFLGVLQESRAEKALEAKGKRTAKRRGEGNSGGGGSAGGYPFACGRRLYLRGWADSGKPRVENGGKRDYGGSACD